MIDIQLRTSIQSLLESGVYVFSPDWDTSTMPCILLGDKQRFKAGTKTEKGYGYTFTFHTFSKSMSDQENYEILAFMEDIFERVEVDGWEILSPDGLSYTFAQDEQSETGIIKHAIATISFEVTQLNQN